MSTGAQRYGDLIKRRRQEKALSRERLARELNTRPQTVMGWERGSTEQFNLDKIREVGDLLDFTYDDYLSIFGLSSEDTVGGDRRGGFEADPELTEDDRRLLRGLQGKLRRSNRRGAE